MSIRNIIVIGGSAGALEALSTIVKGLPHNLAASIFVVIHSSPDRESQLPTILARAGRMPAVLAENEQAIKTSQIYIAPPDRHLLIENRHITLNHGPKENRSRPSIDVLFRSAAINYGPRVIGVVLSGALDDGTAGLRAIKKTGGITIVQNPADAVYPSMPQSGIANSEVDYVLPAAEIAPLLRRLVEQEVDQKGAPEPVKEKLQTEVEIIGQELESEEMIASVDRLGRLSMFTCPECRGTLWELKDGELLRYRCHVGHAFSIESLDAEQADKLEGALWSALRVLEERVALSRKLANQARQRQRESLAKRFDLRAEETNKHADNIRSMLLSDPERQLSRV